MATAPRAGRKGGKIDGVVPTSTPLVASGSAAAISSQTVSPAATTPPSDVATKVDKDTAEMPTQPSGSFSAATSGLFLQFDPSAVDSVGKGVVLGGNKSVRTETRMTNADRTVVLEKLDAFLDGSAAAAAAASENADKSPSDVSGSSETSLQELLRESDFLAVTYSEGMHILSRTALTDRASCVLVVVPSYFVVAKTVAAARKAVARDDLIAEWVGASLSPATTATRVWVVDAKTALGVVASIETAATVTHVVLLKARTHQPSMQLVLAALKQQASFTGKTILAGGNLSSNVNALRAYLEPKRVRLSSPLVDDVPHAVDTLTLEEVCAVTDMQVVTVAVDRTGKFPGPHPKVAEHSLEACIAFLAIALKRSKSPQAVVIFTAEVGEAVSKLEASPVGEYLAMRDELIAAGDAMPSSPAAARDGNHRIHVFHHCDLDEGMDLRATMVFDKGTVKASWVPSPAEGLFPCRRTEWQSVEEQALRKRMLGWTSRGLFVSMYPKEAEAVFPPHTSLHLDLVDMEGALLQSSRVGGFVTPEKLLAGFPRECILRGMQELAECGGIVNATNLGITFTGEVLSRLPTLTDASMLCLYGLVMGLEEAAIAAASVATVHLFPHKPAELAQDEWVQQVASCRRRHCGTKANTSDLLADATIVLKWLQMSLAADKSAAEASCAAFEAEVGVPAYRFQSIVALMSHLRDQLIDYAFVEPFTSLPAVERTLKSLDGSWDVLVVLLSCVLCRKAAVVRNDGDLNPKDTAANMTFLRTNKTATPNAFFPSCVPWRVGSTVVGATVQNSAYHIYLKDVTTLKTSYFLSALLLLSPAVEYSAPQATDQGAVVYFAVAANSQQKRLRVPLEDAARVLEFRDKWNRAFGCLMVLRSLPRNTTLAQFTQFLQGRNKSFHLKSVQKELQDELKLIAEEVVAMEDSKSFPQTSSHRFVPSGDVVDPIPTVAPPSDEDRRSLFRAKSFPAATQQQQQQHQQPDATAAAAAADLQPALSTSSATALAPFTEDDDVETEQSYFARHGPLVEDDD